MGRRARVAARLSGRGSQSTMVPTAILSSYPHLHAAHSIFHSGGRRSGRRDPTGRPAGPASEEGGLSVVASGRENVGVGGVVRPRRTYLCDGGWEVEVPEVIILY